MTSSLAGLVGVVRVVEVSVHENGTKEVTPLPAVCFSPKNGYIAEKTFVEFLKRKQRNYTILFGNFLKDPQPYFENSLKTVVLNLLRAATPFF